MKVTDGQLDEMAQAVRRAGKVTADRPWDKVLEADKVYYRHLVRAVLELIPAPEPLEPIEGARRFTAERSDGGAWFVRDRSLPRFQEAHVAAREVASTYGSLGLGAEGPAQMIKAAADAAERWHRAQKAKERKRWSVNVRAADEITGEAYNLLGPHGESSWFYASDGWVREEVELVAKRRNACLDAEEGRNG